jgi:regulator of cell morphogenesis and NO signaling
MKPEVDFYETNKQVFQTLKQYVPVVDRVHGDNHPEFHEVKKQFEAIEEKAMTAGSDGPNLREEFSKLRQITDNYTVPEDVCESYEAVFSMLTEIEKSYNA